MALGVVQAVAQRGHQAAVALGVVQAVAQTARVVLMLCSLRRLFAPLARWVSE